MLIGVCNATPIRHEPDAIPPGPESARWQQRVRGGRGQECIANKRRVLCLASRGSTDSPRVFELPFEISRLFGTGEAGSCAISREGEIVCWGRFNCDEHDVDTCFYREQPTALHPTSAGYLATDFGNEACVIDVARRVRCSDRLSEDSRPVTWPVRLPIRAVDIVGKHRGLCVLTDSGDVWCWGRHWGREFTSPFRVDIREPIHQLVSTVSTVCGLGVSGAVYCFGQDAAIELPPRSLRQENGMVSVSSNERVLIDVHRVEGVPAFVGILPASLSMLGWTEAGAVWMWGEGGGGLRDGKYDPDLLDSPDRNGRDTRSRDPKRLVSSGVIDAFHVGDRGYCFVRRDDTLHCLEHHRNLGLEELVDRVCYFDGPESRAALERGERLNPPPSSTCD